MRKLIAFAVAGLLVAVAIALGDGRAVVRNSTTNAVVYFGGANTNIAGYAANWVFADMIAPGELREVSLVFTSAATGTVTVAAVKNGITIPRHSAAVSNVTEYTWAPSDSLIIRKGDRLEITAPDVTNSVLVELRD